MQQRKRHTLESITEDAKPFATRTAFKKGNPKAYDAACRAKCLDLVCAHMTPLLTILTEQEISDRAKPFTSRVEFSRIDPCAYASAQRKNILDKVCAHMPKTNQRLTKDEITKRARQFSTKGEFQKMDRVAYQVAWKNDWLYEACAHMVRAIGIGGFDPEKLGILYQVKFTFPDNRIVWKVGITNASARKRIYGMRLSKGIKWEITNEILYASGYDARERERELHAIGVSLGLRYTGEKFMVNGNTEIFDSNLIPV